MSGRGLALRLLATLLLAALTVALHAAVGRYQVAGPNLAPALGAPGWALQGGVTIADGVATILNVDPAGSAGLQFDLPGVAAETHLMLTGTVRTQGVRRGRLGWQQARLILGSRDAGGALRWGLPHEAMRVSGDRPWRTYSRVLHIPPSPSLLLSAHLVNATGQLEIRDIAIRAAQVKPGFDQAVDALKGLWLLLALAWLAPLARAARRDNRLWLIPVAMAAILVATLAPQEGRLVVRTAIASLSPDLREAPGVVQPGQAIVVQGPNMLWVAIDKAGHFTAYAGLAALALLLAPGWLTFGLVLLFAGLTEILQLFGADRGPALFDVVVNMAGVLTGTLPVMLARRFLRGPPDGAGAPPPI